MRDVSDDALAKGRSAIEASLAKFAEKGAISAEDATAALGRISTTRDLDAVAGADVVVEAIIEKVDLKSELFAELDRLAPEGAILATNTSAIPITRIAAATQRPETVVGTHFFSPVPMMKLCELVRGLKTSDETLAAARAWAEGIGKTCIVVNRDVAGFVTTRIITALVNEAISLVESGVASPEDVDIACRLGFGHAMGPLATADLTGIDVMRNATLSVYNETANPKFYPPELLTRMTAAGDLGRKSGRGFYTYGS
jgi:3-hydroxybutyryl-CoA dehydrogenase